MRSQVRVALLFGLACFAVYLTSLRAGPSWDTIPSRLLPFSILREGNLDLDEFGWLRSLDPAPYFLRRGRGGRWVSAYPIATPLLGVPVVLPALWWLRAYDIPDHDVRFRVVTMVTERITAALIAAASAAVLFLALMRLCSLRSAFVMTLVYAFGTNTWATSSQAMWQHGLAELSLAGLSFFLLGADTRRNAFGASVFAALGVLARPTMLIFALLALFHVWRSRRRNLLSFLALPAAGATALLFYNIGLAGRVSGAYRIRWFEVPSRWRLLGLLLSPNRGLLIYTPLAALAVPGIWRARTERYGWLAYLAAGIGLYLLLYASYQGWSGGSVYGPRMLVDVLPAVVVCAASVVDKLLRTRSGRMLFIILATWGTAVQALGVYCDDNSWNSYPASPDSERLWDWNDLQIFRAARAGWHGTDLAPLLRQVFTDPRAVPLQPLSPSDLKGEISIEEELPLRVRRGKVASIRLHVTSRSGVMWPAFSDYGYLECKLAYRWWAGGAVLPEAGGIALPRNLGVGETAKIVGRVEIPDRGGRLELEVMLVQVLDVRKGTFGGIALRVPVNVE
jgi:hypothetical protein